MDGAKISTCFKSWPFFSLCKYYLIDDSFFNSWSKIIGTFGIKHIFSSLYNFLLLLIPKNIRISKRKWQNKFQNYLRGTFGRDPIFWHFEYLYLRCIWHCLCSLALLNYEYSKCQNFLMHILQLFMSSILWWSVYFKESSSK